MSEVRLSRRRGFTFEDLTVDNTNGVYLMGVEKPSSPSLSVFEVTAPLRDGGEFFKNRYTHKEIKVTVGIYDEDIFKRRALQRHVVENVIGKKGRLYFHDEPTLFYIAEVFEEVSEDDDDEFFTQLEITFKCKPFLYSETGYKYEYKNITSPCSFKLINDGNYQANPVITISGKATNVSITIGDRAFSLTNVNGTVYVDTYEMVVYTINKNQVKESFLANFAGKFPVIKKGVNDIRIAGTNMNVSVNVDFYNTYIC